MFCTKCGTEYPTDYRFCPNCGHCVPAGGKTSTPIESKKKKRSFGSSVCIAFAILFAISYLATEDKSTRSTTISKSKPVVQKTQEELRKEEIERQFSAWDGSHRTLTKRIKESMNDPDSFAHIDTAYSDMGNHLIVTTRFRGKNAFGSIVLNWVKVKADLDGNVVEVIAQGP